MIIFLNNVSSSVNVDASDLTTCSFLRHISIFKGCCLNLDASNPPAVATAYNYRGKRTSFSGVAKCGRFGALLR